MIEQDRYQQNHVLYILGIIFLILGMGLFVFDAYLMPFLLLGWVYDVPEFIAHWKHWFHLEYNFSEQAASGLVFLFLFLFGLIFSILAHKVSNRIDNEIYSMQKERPSQVKQDMKKTAGMLSKIIIIVVGTLIVVALLELYIYIPPVE